jgi:hypothetical protein
MGKHVPKLPQNHLLRNDSDENFMYFTESKVTSDFIVDMLAMIFVSAAPLLSATKSGMVGTAKLT